jgi:hypothetical protein
MQDKPIQRQRGGTIYEINPEIENILTELDKEDRVAKKISQWAAKIITERKNNPPKLALSH